MNLEGNRRNMNERLPLQLESQKNKQTQLWNIIVRWINNITFGDDPREKFDDKLETTDNSGVVDGG